MENLINEKLAREAKRANSFSDYKDGSATSSYRIALKEFNEAVDRLKERSNLLEAEVDENVIKMARLMVGCKDITCEDCLSQSKKLFGDNKCALIEYAEVLDKAGYRKQSDVVKDFIKKILNYVEGYLEVNYNFGGGSGIFNSGDIEEIVNMAAAEYGKEE